MAATNVFILRSSQSPVLYIYPSQLHPQTPTTSTGGDSLNSLGFAVAEPFMPKRRRVDDTADLLALHIAL